MEKAQKGDEDNINEEMGAWRLEARRHDGQILEPYFTEVCRTLCDRRLVFEGKLCVSALL